MKPIKTLAQLSTLTLSLMALSLPSYAQNMAQQADTTQTVLVQSVDINQAGIDELATLDQIGQKKAQAIIQYREIHGPFKTVEDLAQVKGIGQNTVEKNRARLLVAQ